MNTNITQDNTSSIVLNLERLSKEYANTLKQYYQLQLDYSNSFNNKFIQLQNSSFWGDFDLSQNTVNNGINECKALCISNPKCTGATYNSDKQYCWLRSGSGNVVQSSNNNYAIVPEKIQLLKQIQNTNNKLTNINQQINTIIQNSEILYKNQSNNRQINFNNLNMNYNKLIAEKIKIENEIKEYEKLDEKQNQSLMRVDSNYLWYYILFGLGLFFIFMLLKLSEYGKSVIDSGIQVIEGSRNVVADIGENIANVGQNAAINAGNILANAGDNIKNVANNVVGNVANIVPNK